MSTGYRTCGDNSVQNKKPKEKYKTVAEKTRTSTKSEAGSGAKKE